MFARIGVVNRWNTHDPMTALMGWKVGMRFGWDYNGGVFSSKSKHVEGAEPHRRQAVYASEAAGLLVIALLLLVLILIRYWQNIDWSLR